VSTAAYSTVFIEEQLLIYCVATFWSAIRIKWITNFVIWYTECEACFFATLSSHDRRQVVVPASPVLDLRILKDSLDAQLLAVVYVANTNAALTYVQEQLFTFCVASFRLIVVFFWFCRCIWKTN